MSAPLQVGVMRAGALGDFVLTLPVIQTLRSAFPDASLMLLAHPPYATLARPEEQIDLHSARLAPLFSESCHLDQELTRRLRRLELLIAYSTDRSGIVERNLARWSGGHVEMADPRPDPVSPCHIIDHLLAPVHRLHLPIATRVPRIPLGECTVDEPEHGPRSTRIVLHPGSGARRKCWSLERYLQVAEGLHQAGCQVSFVCGPAEAEMIWHSGFELSRPASPLALANFLRKADLFIGNDSGPTHLAAATGTRTLALFGPTDPTIWAPRAPWVSVVRSPSGALSAITVDSVLEHARRMLQGPRPQVGADYG